MKMIVRIKNERLGTDYEVIVEAENAIEAKELAIAQSMDDGLRSDNERLSEYTFEVSF